jgi:hypothetical protein
MSERIVLFPAIEKPSFVPVELQGEGNYNYECKNPDCWYCQMMGLKDQRPKTGIPIFNSYLWSESEINRLKELIELKPKQLKPLFPNRSLAAISVQKTVLKQKQLAA